MYVRTYVRMCVLYIQTYRNLVKTNIIFIQYVRTVYTLSGNSYGSDNSFILPGT